MAGGVLWRAPPSLCCLRVFQATDAICPQEQNSRFREIWREFSVYGFWLTNQRWHDLMAFVDFHKHLSCCCCCTSFIVCTCCTLNVTHCNFGVENEQTAMWACLCAVHKQEEWHHRSSWLDVFIDIYGACSVVLVVQKEVHCSMSSICTTANQVVGWRQSPSICKERESPPPLNALDNRQQCIGTMIVPNIYGIDKYRTNSQQKYRYRARAEWWPSQTHKPAHTLWLGLTFWESTRPEDIVGRYASETMDVFALHANALKTNGGPHSGLGAHGAKGAGETKTESSGCTFTTSRQVNLSMRLHFASPLFIHLVISVGVCMVHTHTRTQIHPCMLYCIVQYVLYTLLVQLSFIKC